MDNKKKGIFIAAILVVAVFAMFSASAIAEDFNPNDYDYKSTGVQVSTSTTIAPLSVEWGVCGPIDLVIVLDDTGSMGGGYR